MNCNTTHYRANSSSVPGDPTDNRKEALQYLENLQGGGGTEMMKAIHAALGNQNDPERLRVVCFMTDGYIGNDMAIIDAVQKHAQTARVFAFGVGNSVNRFLIEGMARAGRGEAEIVTLESDGDAAAERFHERIHSPVLTDIAIDFGDLHVEEVYPDPAAIPDLFAAKPLVFKGRYTTPGEGAIILRGRTADGPFERTVPVVLPADRPEHDVLAPLWARERIEWLMHRDMLGMQQGQPNPDIKEAITRLGLAYNLVTQYTSFVAVEEKVITEGGKPKTVEVPVEMPDGVSYEGIFGEEADMTAMQKTQLGRRMSLGFGAVVGQSLAEAEPRPWQSGPAPATAKPSTDGVKRFRIDPATPETSADADTDAPDAETLAKLDPALRNLEAKVVNGAYRDDRVVVENGRVAVVIELADLGEERLQALKDLGVEIVAERHSAKSVLARVRVADLAAVAEREFVVSVKPHAG